MRNSKIRQKQKRKDLAKEQQDYWDNMPASVMFVKMMAASNTPIGLETYERALAEGGEKYFPDEFEFKRKWALVPQEVKDAYNADPHSMWGSHIWEKDLDAPLEVQKWPGIIAATDEDWRIRNEWYSSEKYKQNLAAKNKLKAETYNNYFAEYGLAKSPKDFE